MNNNNGDKMRIAREFIIIPIALAVFGYLIYNAYGFVLGTFASIIFPTDTSINQMVKVFSTSMMILIILEYFLSSTLPNNYFYSRMLGMLFMVSLYIILETYSRVLVFQFGLIILAGSLVSYITQSTSIIKYQNLYALIILLAMNIFILIISL